MELRCNTHVVNSKAQPSRVQDDLSSPQAVERFRKAAAVFTARAIKSRESALKVLVGEGIYTKSGKLTKRYS